MKFVDCFIFYNELDLLNYRLNLLNDTVDWFVIVEATHTFKGEEKPLFFDKTLFPHVMDKIIHIVVDDFPYLQPDVDFAKGQQWDNEYCQRNGISKGLRTLDLQPDDILLISDLDEIPDPRTLEKVKCGEISVVFNSLETDFYYYNLNTKQQSKWYLSKIITVAEYQKRGATCSELRIATPVSIPRGGWHLSYFGDEHCIKNKLNSFSHQEFNNDAYNNLDRIKKMVDSQSDLFGCSTMFNVQVKENTYLPLLYETYLGKYYKA